MPRGPARRLFFALWPDEAMRSAMALATREAVRANDGRPVPPDSLHVTLAFLGSVPERRLPELTDCARIAAASPRGVSAPADPPGNPLELLFDHLEHWPAAQLLCALPAEPAAPVTSLARELQELLVRRGFAPDLKPFRLHVTVARKVVRPGATGRMQPVLWRFTELALVESRTLPQGSLYSVVESSPLGSRRKAANNSETT